MRFRNTARLITPKYPEGPGFTWPSEQQYLTASLENANRLFARAKASVEKKGPKIATAHGYNDSPAEAIVAAAAKAKADLIVMGPDGRRGPHEVVPRE